MVVGEVVAGDLCLATGGLRCLATGGRALLADERVAVVGGGEGRVVRVLRAAPLVGGVVVLGAADVG